MSRLQAGTVAFAVAGVVAIWTSPGQAVLGQGNSNARDPAQVGPTLNPEQAPTLSPAQRARALEVVEADKRLKGLLADRSYTVSEAGPWTRNGHGRGQLGAALLLNLKGSAAELEGDWPTMNYATTDDSAATPYTSAAVRRRAENVAALSVLVDLRHDRVVSVTPSPAMGATTTLGPNETPQAPSTTSGE